LLIPFLIQHLKKNIEEDLLNLMNDEQKLMFGKQRVMSLLNSIFSPSTNENDFRIQEIKYINNDYNTNFGNTSQGSLRFDSLIKCFCYEKRYPNVKSKYIELMVDIKMQRANGYLFVLVDRFYYYNNVLRSSYNRHLIELSLLNLKIMLKY